MNYHQYRKGEKEFAFIAGRPFLVVKKKFEPILESRELRSVFYIKRKKISNNAI
jgi:hypothetical protein